MIDMFFAHGLPRDPQLMLQHDPGLVALSVGVSVLASIMAMHMAALASRLHQPAARHTVLAAGALALGCGIWAMHFIGMLAFPLCARGGFDVRWTALSLLPSVVASWVALTLLTRPQLSAGTLVGGGVLVGAGIGTMHYTGMLAAELAPLMRYDPWWFAASLVVAVLLAIGALWVRFGLRAYAARHPWRATLVAGSVMGMAIAGMHYVGMAALRLQTDVQIGALDGQSYGLLALSVAAITLLVTGLVVALNVGLRFRELFQNIQHNELRLRAMVDTAAEGILLIDGQGLIQLYNGAAERLLGWSQAEVLGQRSHCLVPEPQRAAHDASLRRYLETGESQVVGSGRDVMALHKNGQLVPIYLSLGATQLSGSPLFVAFLTDLRQRRQMEQEEQALRSAKDQAEAVAAARSAFLAHMSHEIRTPMNAIIGFTEAVLDTPLTPSQRSHLGTVQQSAHALLRLLNDILDTAKLDKGAVELEVADFSLHALCTQVLASLKISADKKGLPLVLDCSPQVPEFLHGDALRLQQVLLNLLGNAIKFTEQGQVTLRVDYAQGQLVVEVIDTGIGIEAASLDRIFDPFAQADASTTRRFGGTGLGTTIARQLTELMGGRIGVQSVVGQGSTFRVSLPLPEGQPVLAPSRAFLTQLPPLRVLAVDDVAFNLELLQICLAPGGHQVTLAAHGAEALAAFMQAPFDLVLMDLQMPVMDGLEAARRIRAFEQAEQRPPVPIVALTASVLDIDRKSAAAAGMEGFAIKPLEPLRLFAEIARVLGLAMDLAPAPEPEAEPPAPAAAPAPAPQVPARNAAIDWARGLQLWGEPRRLHQAVERCVQESEATLADLQKALARTDWPALIAAAHR
ncbi:MAG: MHYT domain-containing protein, partial [Burkholderiaceae bacterium]|nr:MHYT domain-containing protein [Burkholderiaceae bacterium]